MLSKSKIKHLQSLQQKKNRQKNALFLIEGDKIVTETLQQDLFKVCSIYATEEWAALNSGLLAQYKPILTIVTPV